MEVKLLISFINSNFLQTLATIFVGFYAYKIAKLQADEAHTIELHAYCAMEGIDKESLRPYIRLQNIGTRIIYLDYYIFNGKKYTLNKQVLPSTYSQALANFYWIELPTNNEVHVSITVSFCDSGGKKFKSEIMAEKVGNMWKVVTYPSKKVIHD